MDSQPTGREPGAEWRWSLVVLLLLVALHGWLVSIGWRNGNLPGHEFRQTQTALSALFIQREGNFAVAYPTPVFGAPWSMPMEFPLYQWAVVGLSNLTNWPLVQAGRAVSLVCFYAGLVALFPLLGRLGLCAPRRLFVIGLMLSCPLYIFYARSFLIETMALALGLWFLTVFSRFIARPSLVWLSLVTVLGTLAGVVKVTTFIVFLVPAGLLTLWEMRRASGRGLPAVAGVGAWALASIVVPVITTSWWTHFANLVKEKNVSARFLNSTNLASFTFGVAETRFSADTLAHHWQNLSQDIAGLPVLAIALLLACTVGRRWWRQIALGLLCYMVPLAIFPTLYSFHDYYAVANAVFLLAALGIAVMSSMELPRKWMGWVLFLAVNLSQFWTYRVVYLPMQAAVSQGGSDLTKATRTMTDPDECMILAGFDWDSSVAFYSQRRALAIRTGMEHDWTYLHQAFKDQRDQPVTVFVGRGRYRDDAALLQLLDQYFHIDPRPLFRWQDATVYGRRDRRSVMSAALQRGHDDFFGVELDPATKAETFSIVNREVLATELLEGEKVKAMALFEPRPWKFFYQFGSDYVIEGGRRALFAHANSRLWFRPGAGMFHVSVEGGVLADAYAEHVPAPDRTDGVEFYIEIEKRDGTRQRLQSRLLDPAHVAADRGFHTLNAHVQLQDGESVVVGNSGGENRTLARDWAMFAGIRITPTGEPANGR